MKPTFLDLTPEERAEFGNGCTLVPDFIFTASCRQHDFNYSRGGYIFAKIRDDWNLCYRMMNDAIASSRPILYSIVSVVYFIGLTMLPLPYFKFTWGRYRTIEEILIKDKIKKSE